MIRGIALLSCAVSVSLSGHITPKTGIQVFEPGVLSAGEIYRGSFSRDGHTFYFFKKVGTGENYRIFSSTRTNDRWSNPEVVDLGGDFSDLYPSISSDGRRLVFSSYRPVPGVTSGKPNAHLWYADRVGGRWGTPMFIARASTPGHYHSWVELGFDDALYFRRTTPDWKVTATLRARWTGADYSEPESYGDAERWKGWRPDVEVVGGSPGPGGRLVFLDVATKNPRTGRRASDIWVSIKHGETWTEPAPLGGGINADGYDVFPFVSPDEADLYFVRDFATFLRIPLAEALASVQQQPVLR